MKLVTERLILRQITPRDAKALVENINNIKVSKYLLVVPHPYTMKDAKEWIAQCSKKWKEKPQKNYEFAIELKKEKKLIGGIGLTNVDRYQGKATIGYWLGEPYWNKKFGSEALEKIIDFAFSKLKLRRLEAEVFKENKASRALLEKFKFKKEGLKRESARSKANGKIHDGIIYGLLKCHSKMH